MKRIEGIQTKQAHPLNSSLALLVSSLSNKRVGTSQYRGFIHSSDRKLSEFEKGVFKILGKSTRKIIASKDLYLSCSVQNPYLPIKPFDQDLSGSPAYYQAFKLSVGASHSVFQPLINGFSHDLDELYTALVMCMAKYFLKEDNRTTLKIPPGHPVTCVIVAENGNVLAWGVNTIGESPRDTIRHAEVNALYSYFIEHPNKDSLPPGTRIYTSLKSCSMCAGAIYDSLGNHKAQSKVIYAQNDPAQAQTALKKIVPPIENQAVINLEKENILLKFDSTYEQLKNHTRSLNAAESLSNPEFSGPLTDIQTFFTEKMRRKNIPGVEQIHYFLQNSKLDLL